MSQSAGVARWEQNRKITAFVVYPGVPSQLSFIFSYEKRSGTCSKYIPTNREIQQVPAEGCPRQLAEGARVTRSKPLIQ